MDINLEVFYGEDDQAKLAHMTQIFKVLRCQVAKNEVLKTTRLHYKAFARVLADDYKKSPDLTLGALRNMHIIFKNTDHLVRREIVEENPVDVFLLTCSKVFVWEFRRLNRIFTRYCECILHCENNGAVTGDDLNKTKGAEGPEGDLTRRPAEKLGVLTVKENSNTSNEIRGAAAKEPKTLPLESRERKIVRTMNINLLTQTKIFTLIILIIKEYFSFLSEAEVPRLSEFRNYFLALGTAEHLVRCLDYEDPLLVRAVVLLLTEVHDEKIMTALLEKGLLPRLTRFVNNKDCQFVTNLIFEILKFPKARGKLTLSFLREVVAGLEKGNIANALTVLNLVSLEKQSLKILRELELPNALVNVALACFKKEDKKDGKKLLWNVLINLASQKETGEAFLGHPALPAFFDYLAQTKTESCFKFLENLFWFGRDSPVISKYTQYSPFLLDFLETADDSDKVRVPAAIGLLSNLYQGKERKPITIMMKIVKKPGVPFQTCVAVFDFLNKALYGMPNCPDLVNQHVAEYSLKNFFSQERKLDDEARFQFLFFLHNLVALRRQKIDINEFMDFVDRFDVVNARLISLVLNCFDAFLSVGLWHKESTGAIFKLKSECFQVLVQKAREGGHLARFRDEGSGQFR